MSLSRRSLECRLSWAGLVDPDDASPLIAIHRHYGGKEGFFGKAASWYDPGSYPIPVPGPRRRSDDARCAVGQLLSWDCDPNSFLLLRGTGPARPQPARWVGLLYPCRLRREGDAPRTRSNFRERSLTKMGSGVRGAHNGRRAGTRSLHDARFLLRGPEANGANGKAPSSNGGYGKPSHSQQTGVTANQATVRKRG
jgi:hypothetical protein